MSRRPATIFAVGLSMCVCAGAQAGTALEHLRSQTAPVFRRGHTLPPLSRWGWQMPFDVRVELCEKWGYGLEFGGYVSNKVLDKMDADPTCANARVVALTASNPKKYPLCVLTHRPLCGRSRGDVPDKLKPELYLRDADGKPVAEGKTGRTQTWRLLSPEAPDAVYQWVAQHTVEPLLRLRKKAPIAVVLNGGEYGLSVYGHAGKYWKRDPRVVKAKGRRRWFEYTSARKAHHEQIITDAVRKALPDRTLYIWYHFGGVPTWDAWTWSYDYKSLRTVADLPGQSLYYRHFNTGWTGKRDLLTYFLCATTQAISGYGDGLSYNWVCAGWRKDRFSDRKRYVGFLKCLYTAGMVGGVAGYFSLPKGLKGNDVGPDVPESLSQMVALGRVHALFSHLEPFLRQGDLLPGPDKHRYPSVAKLPALEFPTGSPDARVLVRKRRRKDQWLITAWAPDGPARDVTVEVPDLGSVTVRARPEGTVYRATTGTQVAYEPPEVKLRLLDPDGLHPSAAMGKTGAPKSHR